VRKTCKLSQMKNEHQKQEGKTRNELIIADKKMTQDN
jgi:hypothetical protein